MVVAQVEILEDYEITPYTLMIIPIEHDGRLYSRVIELEDEFIVAIRPLNIIKKSCEYFGSSYDGRRKGTKGITGVTHKVPIAIDTENSIFFFPIISPTNPDCSWIAYDHVMSFTRIDPQNTSVLFPNKQSIVVNISRSSFENQVYRTSFLKTKLNQRIDRFKK